MLLVLTSAACVASCSDPGAPLGAECSGDSDCASGLCPDGACAQSCGTAEDCASGESCAGYDYSSGGAYCVSTCEEFGALTSGWYCRDGAPTRCEDGGAANACSTCGCPDGQFCEPGTDACESPRDVGEPCFDHRDCASGNCGRVADAAPTCFVRAGAACDGTNCGECAVLPDGSTSCLQACDDSATCGGAEESEALCWSTASAMGGFYCRTPCSTFDPSSCPAGFYCREIRDRDFRMYQRCYPEAVDRGPASYSCDGGGVADACGVCDSDPTNDCVEDCAGTWGGSAQVDMCGTCDADPANDCVQDCAGTWGGTAAVDPCGTCDADPTNDGNVDPCGVCDTDPTNDCVPRCDFGRTVLGGCWFVASDGQSCGTTCFNRGGRYSEQTRRVAGSDGTLAACRAVITAWSPSSTVFSSASGNGGIGCALEDAPVFSTPDYGRHHTDERTTSSAAVFGFQRLCACEF